MEPIINDKAGNPITPGCIIIYGHALGRCAGLQYGKVTKVAVLDKTSYSQPPYRITVQGVDMDFDNALYPPRLTSRKGTLMFPSRILVLHDDQVPAVVKTLLDGVTV